ncbi:MAG TPA: DUF2283 domain-containing protein [Candidatus Brocadiia bacterium]|nr:DUF2283 domain-containing protein [Planctomycetota bacterium]MDO8094185.1 DUF2283 domain-containing protein [Candidatus Brocadiales bacterium]
MKIEYTKGYGGLIYINLQSHKKGGVKTIEVNDNLNLDIDGKGNLVGIEILNTEDYPLKYLLSPENEIEIYDEKDNEVIEIVGKKKVEKKV